MNRKVTKTTTKNWKTSLHPYASANVNKYGYDANVGTQVSKGPVSLDIGTSFGSGYKPETDIIMSVNIPITKRVKSKKTKL